MKKNLFFKPIRIPFYILFASILFSVISSCSKEIENNAELENKTESAFEVTSRESMTISDLANEIYKDEDFNKYVESYLLFDEKINVKNNLNEIKNLKDDLELTNWIRHNISKTNFGSIAQFEESNDQINDLKNNFLNKFETTLENFRNYPNFNEEFKIELDKVAQIIDNNEMQRGNCHEMGSRCIRRAQRNATIGLAVSAVSFFFNPIVAAAGALATSMYLSNALEACQDSFDACMGS